MVSISRFFSPASDELHWEGVTYVRFMVVTLGYLPLCKSPDQPVVAARATTRIKTLINFPPMICVIAYRDQLILIPIISNKG